MDMQTERTLQHAELLLQNGRKEEMRLLLGVCLSKQPGLTQAWWLLSQAVEDENQERDCLERLLQLDPKHVQGRERMAILKGASAPEKQPASLPEAETVSPFIISEVEEKPDEKGSDLFSREGFQPAPAEDPAAAAAQDSSIRSLQEPSEVPSWAEPPSEPPAEPGGRVELAGQAGRKKRTWIFDVIIISIVLCILLAVVGYFGIQELGQSIMNDIQTTQQVAQYLTSHPPQTLEPTWTPSPTFTTIPTETLTPTNPVLTPTTTSVLVHTLTRTAIHPGLIGLSTGLYPPDFSLLELASGTPVTLRDQIGKPVLLFFFATWCPYCKAEIADLQTLYENYQGEGLLVLAINAGEPTTDVETFRTTHELTFPILLDPDNAVFLLYQAGSIPEHIFISPTGRIKFVMTGQLSYVDLENKVKATMRIFPTPTP